MYILVAIYTIIPVLIALIVHNYIPKNKIIISLTSLLLSFIFLILFFHTPSLTWSILLALALFFICLKIKSNQKKKHLH
ncbi:hypothetical protein BAMA_16170 [Bacillus manliponensis]|uniref:Uncharacterized protein n=1 Tax=Bacillus manliponensis TaxID=574376 RepID=A0A073JQ65_9BACI|nr:hypothetical protein [Bacillus manliponensis]KEK17229.1 hypothetical protein BAMA_16170 [Bacillus manliponensis]